jgi:hypothetical protein
LGGLRGWLTFEFDAAGEILFEDLIGEGCGAGEVVRQGTPPCGVGEEVLFFVVEIGESLDGGIGDGFGGGCGCGAAVVRSRG